MEGSGNDRRKVLEVRETERGDRGYKLEYFWSPVLSSSAFVTVLPAELHYWA